jgi:nitrite reductase (NADH) large subunit
MTAACTSRPITVDAIVAATGASTLCGTCRPLLEQFAGAGGSTGGRVLRGLLASSVVALVAAAAVLILPPVALSTSVRDAFPSDVLWRDHVYRQASGFTLLVLSALASLLALRKRWRPAASLGSFPAWRVAHVLVGVLTLVAIAVHTGGRLGDNLNLALMTCFGALNVLGALAGAVTAVERRLTARRGRLWRSVLVTAHILATWPLPTLIAFHVLSAYYF